MGRGKSWTADKVATLRESLARGRGAAWCATEFGWSLSATKKYAARLNKGEAHHALKNALRIGRQGEIRDRTAEGQHYRMAGLNLLAAIIIYWNTKKLGHAVDGRRREGLDCSSNMIAHISPLGWAHILLTGEYRWGKHA